MALSEPHGPERYGTTFYRITFTQGDDWMVFADRLSIVNGCLVLHGAYKLKEDSVEQATLVIAAGEWLHVGVASMLDGSLSVVDKVNGERAW
jgi:hypothetical protein